MTLKLAEANRAVEAALAKASSLGVQISMSVCDAYGHLVGHQRMDGVFTGAAHGSIGSPFARQSQASRVGNPSAEPQSTLQPPGAML
jgi:uncharacterized protein GlcG (DUF336 family)